MPRRENEPQRQKRGARTRCKDEARRRGTRARRDPDPLRREKVAHVDIEVDVMELRMDGDPVEHRTEAHVDTLIVDAAEGWAWAALHPVHWVVASTDKENYRRS